MVEVTEDKTGDTLSVPEGFKQTEVGVIPEDWEVVEQQDVVKYINGRAYSKHEWESRGVPVVRLQNLTQRGGDFYYSNLPLPEKQYMYHGDLIFMWSASFGPYIWWGGKAIYHYHIWKIDCNEEMVDKTFYFFKLQDITERLKKGTSGSTMLHLTKSGMEKFQISLPPTLTEQTAIATALSDMDALIEAQEALLSKKRALKQGAMQELLTGKRRLVETDGTSWQQTEVGRIPGDWEVKSLGEIIDFQGGSQPSIEHFRYKESEGYIRFIQIRDYKTDKAKTYIPVGLAKRFCEADDVMIGRYGPPIFQILRGLKGSYNVALIKASPRGIPKELCYHILKQDSIFSFVESLSKRTGGQTGVNLKVLKTFQIPLPSTPAEQAAIATALSDMDRELEQLEAQLAKYRQLKRGMMQELLTGRKRLI